MEYLLGKTNILFNSGGSLLLYDAPKFIFDGTPTLSGKSIGGLNIINSRSINTPILTLGWQYSLDNGLTWNSGKTAGTNATLSNNTGLFLSSVEYNTLLSKYMCVGYDAAVTYVPLYSSDGKLWSGETYNWGFGIPPNSFQVVNNLFSYTLTVNNGLCNFYYQSAITNSYNVYTGFTYQNITRMCYAVNNYIAVGYSGGTHNIPTIWQSDDGKTWSLKHQSGFNERFTDIIYAQNKFIVISPRNFAYSINSGATWITGDTKLTQTSNFEFYSLSTDGTYIFAYGHNQISYSNDGIIWIGPYNLNLKLTNGYDCIFYWNGNLYATDMGGISIVDLGKFYQ